MSSTSQLSQLVTLGLSHRTAPVDVRERLAVPPARIPLALRQLLEECPVSQAVILSTCNRVEVYSVLDRGTPPEILGKFLCRYHAQPEEGIRERIYIHRGREAVRHLFRVASGLDSQVVGESQILSQVKEAYLRAQVEGQTGKTLNALFQKALKVGKDVRTNTRIGRSGASVPSVAVGFMKKIFDDLASRVVMVIGSGDVGKVTLAHLSRQGVRGLLMVNRSGQRARELSDRFGGEVVPYRDFPARLPEADIVITSTSAPHPIIRREEVRAAMAQRGKRPQVYMDIAIPRDVEPEVGGMENVHLYNVDDLDRVVGQNREGWGQEIAKGEEIVDSQVDAYVAMQARADLGPVITRLRADLRALIRDELSGAIPGNPALIDEEMRSLDDLADHLAAKILHGPIVALRSGSTDGVRAEMLNLVRRLFSSEAVADPVDLEGGAPHAAQWKVESEQV